MVNLTVAQALVWATQILQNTSDSPKLDAEVLLLHVLDKPKSYLFTWPEAELTEVQLSTFKKLIAERETGHPVAHLVGVREFWSLELEVNNSTLIPRPDTETLVEKALNLDLPTNAKMLDLGTGTGAIALSLASEQPDWQVTAVDYSEQAVSLAKRNQQKLALNNVTVLQSDWFSSVSNQQFDLIVSNPPYIDELDEHLNQGDVRFEPKSALVAPDNGMADIKLIIEQARQYLAPNGHLLIEHGYQQALLLQEFFAQMAYSNILTIKDMAGCDRVTMAQWQGKR